jgi:hypothetical protein
MLPSRRVRFLLLSILAAGLAAGCQGEGGAVSVRWQIVDLTRGNLIRPNDVGRGDGSCGHEEPDGSPVETWVIPRVRLVVADPKSGAEVIAADDKRLIFNCSQREGTTPFSLPLGQYAMSLLAVDADTEVVTPAPAVRTLKRAELVSLDVVELGIHPPPRAPLDGSVQVPDLGPVN